MKKSLSLLIRIICGIISIQIILFSFAFGASYSTSGIDGIINKSIAYQKSLNNGSIYNPSSVGTRDSDWFIVGANRSGKGADNQAYRNKLSESVNFSQMSATDLHRISLAVLASGGNPLNFANSNLISSGVFNRGKTSSLGKEGVIGWIWGLIALDSGQYSIPSGSSYSRDDIIVEIIRQQLSDGGFSNSGSKADSGVTALAISALAPYINQEFDYSYTMVHTGANVQKSVRTVINEAVERLSTIQNPNGSFSSSSGTPNSTSTAHVLIGLCSVGINPNTDSRFIKSGHSAIDGLSLYQMQSGGFAHSFAHDTSNSSIAPNAESSYATSQAIMGLGAYRRLINNQRRFFDFGGGLSANVSTLNQMLGSLTDETVTQTDIDKIKELYSSLSTLDKSYVYEYFKFYSLSESAKQNSATEAPTSAPTEKKSTYDTGAMAKYKKAPSAETVSAFMSKAFEGIRLHNRNMDERANTPTFTDEDRALCEKACKTLSTENYYSILKLMNKLDRCEPFDDAENIKVQLSSQKAAIETVISDIENINTEISESFSPLDEVSVSNRERMHGVAERISVLSDFDKKKIQNLDDFNKALNRVNNTHTTILVGVVVIQLLVVISAIVMFVTTRIIKQKNPEDE